MLIVTIFNNMICMRIICMLITLCTQPIVHILGFVLSTFICKMMRHVNEYCKVLECK